jgi:hypothetical protein
VKGRLRRVSSALTIVLGILCVFPLLYLLATGARERRLEIVFVVVLAAVVGLASWIGAYIKEAGEKRGFKVGWDAAMKESSHLISEAAESNARLISETRESNARSEAVLHEEPDKPEEPNKLEERERKYASDLSAYWRTVEEQKAIENRQEGSKDTKES